MYMAPATIAGASQARASRRGGWDRESVISAIQEWVGTYGEPPRAADWNPSSAKWSGQRWRVERYREGRQDGSAWPALNSAKRPFGGSLNAAIRAAGFEPAKPGPTRPSGGPRTAAPRAGGLGPANPGPTRRTDAALEQAAGAMISRGGRAILPPPPARARGGEKRVGVLGARLARRNDDNKLQPHSD